MIFLLSPGTVSLSAYFCLRLGTVHPPAAAGAWKPPDSHDLCQHTEPLCRSGRGGETNSTLPLCLFPEGKRRGGWKFLREEITLLSKHVLMVRSGYTILDPSCRFCADNQGSGELAALCCALPKSDCVKCSHCSPYPRDLCQPECV